MPGFARSARLVAASVELNIRRLGTARSVLHHDVHPLTRLQGGQARPVQHAGVQEHVLAVVVGEDEALALGGIVELDETAALLDRAARPLEIPRALPAVMPWLRAASKIDRGSRGIDADDGRHNRTALAIHHLAGHARALRQRAVAGLLDDRDVAEHVGRAVVEAQEAENPSKERTT